MEPNPYEAPQSPGYHESVPKSADQDPTQLLAEIRDIQRELLNMTRQAVARQRRVVRVLLGLLLFMVLILFLVLGNAIYALRSMPMRSAPGFSPYCPSPRSFCDSAHPHHRHQH